MTQVFAVLRSTHYQHDIVKFSNKIGRGEDCDILLVSKGVSRHHADLIVEEDANTFRFYLVDNNSANGTFVNSLRLSANSRHSLRFGDVIYFSENSASSYRFESPENAISSSSHDDGQLMSSRDLSPGGGRGGLYKPKRGHQLPQFGQSDDPYVMTGRVVVENKAKTPGKADKPNKPNLSRKEEKSYIPGETDSLIHNSATVDEKLLKNQMVTDNEYVKQRKSLKEDSDSNRDENENLVLKKLCLALSTELESTKRNTIQSGVTTVDNSDYFKTINESFDYYKKFFNTYSDDTQYSTEYERLSNIISSNLTNLSIIPTRDVLNLLDLLTKSYDIIQETERKERLCRRKWTEVTEELRVLSSQCRQYKTKLNQQYENLFQTKKISIDSIVNDPEKKEAVEVVLASLEFAERSAKDFALKYEEVVLENSRLKEEVVSSKITKDEINKLDLNTEDKINHTLSEYINLQHTNRLLSMKCAELETNAKKHDDEMTRMTKLLESKNLEDFCLLYNVSADNKSTNQSTTTSRSNTETVSLLTKALKMRDLNIDSLKKENENLLEQCRSVEEVKDSIQIRLNESTRQLQENKENICKLSKTLDTVLKEKEDLVKNTQQQQHNHHQPVVPKEMEIPAKSTHLEKAIPQSYLVPQHENVTHTTSISNNDILWENLSDTNEINYIPSHNNNSILHNITEESPEQVEIRLDGLNTPDLY